MIKCDLCAGEGKVYEGEADARVEKVCLHLSCPKDLENDPHMLAGLAYGGHDSEGEVEWIGTDEEWSKYEDIISSSDDAERDMLRENQDK